MQVFNSMKIEYYMFYKMINIYLKKLYYFIFYLVIFDITYLFTININHSEMNESNMK